MVEVWVSGGLMGRPRGSVSRGPFRSQGTCLGVFSAHYLIQVGYEVEPLAEYSTIHPSGEYLVPYLVSEDAYAQAIRPGRIRWQCVVCVYLYGCVSDVVVREEQLLIIYLSPPPSHFISLPHEPLLRIVRLDSRTSTRWFSLPTT